MTALPQPEENESEQQPFIPTSKMIEVATEQQVSSLNAGQMRKIRRLVRKGFTGCVVIVCKDGRVVDDGIYQVRQFIIEPAE
jgi:hypothetical protein